MCVGVCVCMYVYLLLLCMYICMYVHARARVAYTQHVYTVYKICYNFCFLNLTLDFRSSNFEFSDMEIVIVSGGSHI